MNTEHPAPSWARRRQQFLLVLLTLVVLFFYGQIAYTVAPYSRWDLRSYLKMATAAPRLAADVPRPFCYRLLGPYLVGLLPLPEPSGFYLLTALAAIALALSLPSLLQEDGLSPAVAWLTTALLLWNRNLLGYSLWNYFQVNDTLSLLYLVWLLRALRQGRWASFSIVLLLGALTRETALLMLPTAAAYLWEKRASRREWGSLGGAVLPALAAAALLRALIAPAGGPSLWEALRLWGGKVLRPESWFRLLINPYLPLSLLPLLFVPRTVAFFRERRHLLLLLLLVYGSTLLGQNMERLVAPAFVVFYPLIGHLVQEGLGDRWDTWGVLLVGAVLASLHHQVARFPLPTRTWTLLLSLGSLAMVTAWATIRVLRCRPAPREMPN